MNRIIMLLPEQWKALAQALNYAQCIYKVIKKQILFSCVALIKGDVAQFGRLAKQ